MIRPTLFANTIAVGASRPFPRTTLSAVNLMAYGAATWDWARVHYDLPYAQQLAFPNVFVDGQTYGSILARHLIDWFGPKAFVRKMAVSYRSMVFAGETIEGSSEVVDIRSSDSYALATVSQVLKKGNDVVVTCKSEVQLPR